MSLEAGNEVIVTEVRHTGLCGLSKGSYRGNRRALEDRLRELAWDKLLLPTAPLAASLMGTLRGQKKASKSTYLRSRGCGHAQEGAHTRSFVLRVLVSQRQEF